MRRLGATLVILAVTLAAPGLWAAGRARYSVVGETVKDSKTGRTWQREVPIQVLNWADSKSYCKSLNLGGFASGWRLPTKAELESIVADNRSSAPYIDATAFPSTPRNYFWTSTPYSGAPNNAYAVHFGLGDTAFYLPTAKVFSIRCVR